MPLGDQRTSTRFFASLALLSALLVLVSILGLLGLRAVDRANNQVFDDNFRTAEATSQLVADLGRAQSTSLEILASESATEAERRRTQLSQLVIPQISTDIARVLHLHAKDPAPELAQTRRISHEWKSFVSPAGQKALSPGARPVGGSARTAEVARVEGVFDPLIGFVTARQKIEVEAAATAHASARGTFTRDRDWLIVAAMFALLAVAVLIRVGLTLRGLLKERSAERSYGESASEYIDVLQGAANEDEAQSLLRRQIERTHPGANAVVLVRNNSDDRLEARTSLSELEALREPLLDAVPRSCIAVRFARGHVECEVHEPLAGCAICGQLPGSSTCEPLLVGGEVIGSVLISQANEPDPDDRRRLRETVAQAAPVLGNLRNLALAERRAATDALTGLANQRAVQDTLKRMVAQASRTLSPLAAVLIDLDHFKMINDVYGHDRGDELLAAVGVVLRNVIRESDFVGRYGGEEFLVLLPAGDRQGAVHVAESVRSAIAAIRISGVAETIAASAGVAMFPDDGGDSVTLFKAVDRALYAAKHAGRNRVHVADDAISVAP